MFALVVLLSTQSLRYGYGIINEKLATRNSSSIAIKSIRK